MLVQNKTQLNPPWVGLFKKPFVFFKTRLPLQRCKYRLKSHLFILAFPLQTLCYAYILLCNGRTLNILLINWYTNYIHLKHPFFLLDKNNFIECGFSLAGQYYFGHYIVIVLSFQDDVLVAVHCPVPPSVTSYHSVCILSSLHRS
jgi:hypothetical protein